MAFWSHFVFNLASQLNCKSRISQIHLKNVHLRLLLACQGMTGPIRGGMYRLLSLSLLLRQKLEATESL